MSRPHFTLGKSILSLIALITSIAPYLADWNETHIHNPHWPPHARFHNGQTMTTGLLLGLLTLYYLHRPIPSLPPSSYQSNNIIASWINKKTEQHYLNLALLFLHLYFVPGLSGVLYPGADWMDPEFGESKKQLWGFSGLLGCAWAAWWVERRR